MALLSDLHDDGSAGPFYRSAVLRLLRVAVPMLVAFFGRNVRGALLCGSARDSDVSGEHGHLGLQKKVLARAAVSWCFYLLCCAGCVGQE